MRQLLNWFRCLVLGHAFPVYWVGRINATMVKLGIGVCTRCKKVGVHEDFHPVLFCKRCEFPVWGNDNGWVCEQCGGKNRRCYAAPEEK